MVLAAACAGQGEPVPGLQGQVWGMGRPHQGQRGPFPSIHRCFPTTTSFFIIALLVTTLLCSTAYLAPGKGGCVPKSARDFFPEALVKSIAPLLRILPVPYPCTVMVTTEVLLLKKRNRHLIHLKDLRYA